MARKQPAARCTRNWRRTKCTASAIIAVSLPPSLLGRRGGLRVAHAQLANEATSIRMDDDDDKAKTRTKSRIFRSHSRAAVSRISLMEAAAGRNR